MKISRFQIALFALLVLGAGGLVFLRAKRPLSPSDAHAALFMPDAKLGWRPRPHAEVVTAASRQFRVTSNELGFRDESKIRNDLPGLLVAGDSFVWGYDVDNDEMFTEKLRSRLPGWEIHNQGVSAYGTDQSYLLLEETLPLFRPKAVLLVFCSENDRHDNTHFFHGKYPKPAFRLEDGKLTLRSETSEEVIVPDPTFAILSAMKKRVEAAGAIFWVALTETEPEVEAHLKKEGIEFLVLRQIERFPAQGNHWTAAGHDEVANRLAAFVKERVTAGTERSASDTLPETRRSSRVSRKSHEGN